MFRKSSTTVGETITKEATPLTDDEIEISEDGDSKFDLYEEEYHTRPPMTKIFSQIANYTGGIEPTSAETKQLREKSVNKLGTLLGVYFPCIQNIFGVLYFLRLVWIIGCAGTAQGFTIVFICCCTTMLTTLSMSAIATNGKVPAGGSYFMISRSLGPEFGGTVGILFYFGTTVAAAMYIIGAIEVLLQYIVPQASLFGPVDVNPEALFNNTRIYGIILLCILMGCVFIGIRFVSKFATLSLACVIGSILCVYIGIFTTHSGNSVQVCMLGDRLLSRDILIDKLDNDTFKCSKEQDSPLYRLYCGNTSNSVSDPSCHYLNENNITEFSGFPGLYKSLLPGDFFQSYYTDKNKIYGKHNETILENRGQNPNMADIYLSFTILIAIFFPSVTGIMAGSNRSGDLANPSFSIPVGTIAACTTTSVVYLSSVLLFASTIEHPVMRDKFGLSVGGGLIVAKLAWPNHWVILIGSFLSTVGAGLQSLTGAPRLLQAIAQDNVIPFLDVFKVTTKRGEPLRAQGLTFLIAFMGVLIASIDYIAPLITMFFLMFYGFVNLATALNGFLQEPSWRPRFKYYHWTTSLLGLMLCIALMFVSSWYYALVAIVLAGGIYKYIEYRGAAKEWGDATQGFRMSAAKKAILKLGDKPIHTKNWRPQILVLVHLNDSNTAMSHELLLDFCSQLKAGRGLTMVGSVIEGELINKRSDVFTAKETLYRLIHEKKIKGLSEVIVAPNVNEGLKVLCQAVGLGSLRHNCVMLSFPENWQDDERKNKWKQFMATIRCCQAIGLAVLVPKGIDKFPCKNSKKNKLLKNNNENNITEMSGTIDMWCIVHDGGLLMLLSHLLIRSRAWNKCTLRIFVVASENDNTVHLKKEVKQFIYDLRIVAEVEIVELDQADISAYVFQRTMDMNMRKKLLENMNFDSKKEFQSILDKHRVKDDVNFGIDSKAKVPVPSVSIDIEDYDASSNIKAKENDKQSENLDKTEKPKLPNDGMKNSNTEQTLILTPDATPQQNQRSVTFANPINPHGDETPERINEFTFSPASLQGMKTAINQELQHSQKLRPPKTNRRMHNAVKLNEMIRSKSQTASLVLVNLPGPSKNETSDFNYMEYVDTLTEGLERVVLVRGTGKEVITAFAE